MMATNYRRSALSWDTRSDRFFNLLSLFTVVSFMGTGLLMSLISLPKVDRNEHGAIPERIAKLIMERPEPEPKPETKPEARSEQQVTEVPKPRTKVEEKARKNAQGSGLLVLAKELSALADTSSINSLVNKKINTAPTNTAAATVDTSILTADTGRKSAGVRQESHVAHVGTTKLEDNRQQLAQRLLAGSEKPAGTPGGPSTPGRNTSVRGDEDVAIVMDQHKSMLHSIYNRARRVNPGLKGKIVLIITILPSGQVSNVVIKSSELNAPDLESSLVARVRQFDFGKRQGGPLTVTVPVEFLPS